MDLTAFDGPLGYVATVAVGAIIAVGATTFLPRVAMATVHWARCLIDADYRETVEEGDRQERRRAYFESLD